MPDETLLFRLGTDRDRALLLHVLLEHLGARIGMSGAVETSFGATRSFVRIGESHFDAGTGQLVPAPSEPILFRLGGEP